jgi:putative ABC transport system permease protein
VKGKFKSGLEGKGFRSGLVVVQFTVSIVLIIYTTFVFQQLNFFSEKNLGFNKENLLVIDHVERIENGSTLTDAISGIPGVLSTSLCTALPLHMNNDFFRPEHSDKDLKLNFASGDEQYLSTLDVPLIMGRNFSSNNPADVDRVILNETAMRTMGWPVDKSVIGRIIDYPNENTKFEVIGVVQDYNFNSLEKKIEPMAIFHIKSKVFSQRKFALIRIISQDSKAWASTFIALKKNWKQHAGDLPFKYEFVDQTFAAKLQTQQQFGRALQIMAGLAILLACLGLFGMVIYTLEQRTKEIGIRKISGASIWNILVLNSQDYTRLIIIAFAVGTPLSYWLIQQWLQDFGNRIKLSGWVFVLTGLGILLLSFLITGYHSVKAALTNPVEALKDE